MMRKLICVAVLVCMTSMLGMAAETPKPEVYGGYQFTSLDGGWHASGWNGAANMYVTRYFGVTGDFSGVYKTGESMHSVVHDNTIDRTNAMPVLHDSGSSFI